MPVKRLSIIAAAAAFGLALVAMPRTTAAHDEPVGGSLIGAGVGAVRER